MIRSGENGREHLIGRSKLRANWLKLTVISSTRGLVIVLQATRAACAQATNTKLAARALLVCA